MRARMAILWYNNSKQLLYFKWLFCLAPCFWAGRLQNMAGGVAAQP